MRFLRAALRGYFWYFPIDFGKWALWLSVKDKTWISNFPAGVFFTRFGFNMQMDSAQYILKFLYFWGFWEPDETEVIRRLLKIGDIFVDVGANVGYYSLMASKIVGQAGKIYAIEAIPTTIIALKKNIQLNSISNITVFECAATEHRMAVRFANRGTSGAEVNSMRHTMDGSNFWDVKGERVDEIVPLSPPPNLVKIDIEGAEMLALRGMKEMLSSPSKPVLVCEVIDSFLAEMGSSATELFEYLRDCGYTYAYTCSQRGLRQIQHNLSDFRNFKGNVVFSPHPISL